MYMANYSGYLIIFDEAQRSELLEEQRVWRERFTDALSAPDWGFKDVEVCIISFGGNTFDLACLAKRGKRVATAKYHVEFFNFVDLESLPVSEVEHRIVHKLLPNFIRSATGRGQRVPPATWTDLIRVIKELRSQITQELDHLFRLRVSSKRVFQGDAANTIVLERDAVGLALDIFDPSKELRKKTLSKWDPSEGQLTPFLEGVEAIRLSEEQMLAHDLGVFPNSEAALMPLGTRFNTGNRLLDVIYLNRTAVER